MTTYIRMLMRKKKATTTRYVLWSLIFILLNSTTLWCTESAICTAEQRVVPAKPEQHHETEKSSNDKDIPVIPCKIASKSVQKCTFCTLDQWQRKVSTLKERPIQFSSLPSKQHYEQNILTFKEFISTLQKAADCMKQKSKLDRLWLGKESVFSMIPELYTLERPSIKPAVSIENFPFKPVAQRIILPRSAEVIMFCDLHGSIHSFLRDLQKLRKEGYLDNNFRLTKRNLYMLFLGDYIDRGIYGVEVIYTLARLWCANPQRVIVVRGNHEDYILAPDFRKKHTKREEKDNAPSFIDELYAKFTMDERDEVTIFRFYELLPVVLYLGHAYNGHTTYMQCCHAGIEIGYNPYNLLHAPCTIHYEYIDKLWRKKHFNEKIPFNLQNHIKAEFSLDILCNDIRDFKPKAPFYKIEGTDHVAYLGFMWNDFFVDPLKVVAQRGKHFTGWVVGQSLAHEVFHWGNSEKLTLKGVFRGHQHNNETGGPMLNKLCCGKGIVDVWDDNTVYTLVSAPDSKLDDTGQRCFTYDSFAILKAAGPFEKWQFKHYTRDSGLEKPVWSVKTVKMQQKT